MATAVLTFLSAAISLVLSGAIAKPILTAEAAARRIAQAHSGVVIVPPSAVRIPEQYKTKELARLSRSINELALELEEGRRRQKQLSSDIAHELRTPLTCLQGGIEAMIDGVHRADRKHLESCYEEILRLTGLVEDLHTLTGLEWENITLNKSVFDLANLLCTTAEQFRNTAREKGIEIILNLAESPIAADYDRLKQVFINLISNAVKYTDRGGVAIGVEKIKERKAADGFAGGSLLPVSSLPLAASVAPAAPTGPLWEITVADTGIGIPEEDIPYIFERLYRSDKSRSRSTGGSGIGLAIAAAIVRAHGGTISAESSGRGSVFRVHL
jgi:signal transduction histidine kinase